MKHSISAFAAAGFNGHLATPVDVARLCAVLESVALEKASPTRNVGSVVRAARDKAVSPAQMVL